MSGDDLHTSRSGASAGSPGQAIPPRVTGSAVSTGATEVKEIKTAPADSSWLFTSCSVRGTSHERKGMPNQDYVQISCERNGPPLPIRVALADGHGSQRSFRSQTGSQLAVQAALEEMMVMQRSGLLDQSVEDVEAACKAYWGTNVWRRWQKSVLEHIKQNPFTEKDFQNHPDLLPAEPRVPAAAPALPGIKMSGDHLPPYRNAPAPPPAAGANTGFFSQVLPEDWLSDAQERPANPPATTENTAGKNEGEGEAETLENASASASMPAAVSTSSTTDFGSEASSQESGGASAGVARSTRRLPRPLPSNGVAAKSPEVSRALARLLAPDNTEEPPIEWFVAYGSTILAVIITERWLFISQLGDGDILLVDAEGHVTRPLPQDKKLFANETTSLCCPDADVEFRLKVLSLEQFSPSVILLATDGYANSFQSDEGFLQVGTDIWNIICECGFDVIPRDIESWLRDASREGSGDDISVGILCRAALAARSAPTPSPSSAAPTA